MYNPWLETIIQKINISNIFMTLAIIYFFVSLPIIIIRVRSGDDIDIDIKFFKLTLKPNKEIERLKKDFEKLAEEYNKINSDSKHKSYVLNLIDQVGQNAQKVLQAVMDGSFEEDQNDFIQVFDRAISFIFPAIIHAVRNGKTGRSRIAILVPDDSKKYLKILRGHLYNPEDINNLRLHISSSFAGVAYTSKKINCTGDINSNHGPFMKVSNQSSYSSLVCAPIIFFDEPLGVLNIDCTEKDAFSPDDIDYIRFFANQLALLIAAYNLHIEQQAVMLETAISTGKEQVINDN
jgi:hypothetical protein